MSLNVKALGEKMVTATVGCIARMLKPLEERIKALEARPTMEYRGTWTESEEYRRGDFVTHSGSMFHCWVPTKGSKPGESEAWQLCVKRGRDAR